MEARIQDQIEQTNATERKKAFPQGSHRDDSRCRTAVCCESQRQSDIQGKTKGRPDCGNPSAENNEWQSGSSVLFLRSAPSEP